MPCCCALVALNFNDTIANRNAISNKVCTRAYRSRGGVKMTNDRNETIQGGEPSRTIPLLVSLHLRVTRDDE